MKTILLLLAVWLGSASAVLAQTSLYGKVTDDSGEPIIFGSVALNKDGILVKGAETDFDGNYQLSNIDPGIYDIEVAYVGYSPKKIQGIEVLAGIANKLDIELQISAVNLDEVVVVDYKVPLVEQDNTTSGAVITSSQLRRIPGNRKRSPRKRNKKKNQTTTSEQIKNLPTRNINALAATSAGVSSSDGNNVVVRGTRDNGTDYYVDGIRVRGQQIPETEEVPKSSGGEDYASIPENQYVDVSTEVFSTFSIDVDKAAYSNVRRFINQKQLPPVEAVRTEELINYFQYDYPQPEDEHPFAVYTELSECPWQQDHQLLHIGLKGREQDPADAPPANLVFLIDISGSMSSANKLPLVIEAFELLVEQLRAQDRVSIVTYAGSFKVALEPCPGNEKNKIIKALRDMRSGGGTAGGAALERAYELAAQYFDPEGSNRVIMATDGDFNIGISSPEELEKFIEKKRESGIYLSVLGFGMGNLKDNRLEVLADKGNGNYAYIDNIEEAEKLFITEMTGTLYAIAKDVKLQIEFDKEAVESYRLIGYENRMLEKEDFEDDTKDAGELGAGHTVTALYEIIPKANGSSSEELLTVHLRYKQPKEEQSYYLSHKVSNEVIPLEQASDNFRFSASVAAYALCLRQSSFMEGSTYKLAKELADGARQDDLEGEKAAFVDMVKQTAKLDKRKSDQGQVTVK
ncbi:MAG: von Willebrand factor type A domain-containing protein [Chitinophagales bacterium]|nr:von Willebrand factor type A domain-containing protein [Chitinophagales bacterium]